MKTPDRKEGNRMVRIQEGKIKFIEKLSEAIGVKLPAEAGLVKPITILVDFLESKDIHFLQKISTGVIIEFQVRVFMTYAKSDRQVLNAGVKSFLYLCAHEHWIDEKLVSLWDALSEESFITGAVPGIGLN